MSEITILRIGDNIIVPIQAELHDQAASRLQEEVLGTIEATGAGGLLIDVSAVTIVDSFLGRILGETSRMAALMGSATVLVGLKKEVVMTIIMLGIEVMDLHTALNIEDGIRLLDELKKRAGRPAEDGNAERE